VLARLGGEELERLWFPLGELEKPAVRELARSAGLPVADKAESQDLCFLAGLGSRAFMRRHGGPALQRAATGGEIVDSSGRVLGRHEGHHRFTVGQRRGLGVAASEPLYVLAKDARRNRVTVGPRSALARRTVELRPGRLHRSGREIDAVKLRYRSAAIPCRVKGDPGAGSHEQLELALDREVTGAAPGQVACLLRGGVVLGWGTIAEGADDD
jgi:tRNA-uridine 2-sulfurtransferase